MGAGKSLVWVPENEKLQEKLDEAQSWSKAEDLTGWLALNDGKQLGKAIKEAEGTGRLNLGFNGLGDAEAKEIAKGIKANRTIKKLSLANNHIHSEGMEAIAADQMDLENEETPSPDESAAEGLMPPEDGKIVSVLEVSIGTAKSNARNLSQYKLHRELNGI